MESYQDFVEAVLAFRALRDMDDACSPGNEPELWLDIELEEIVADPDWTDEVKRRLMLIARFADLLDDRKAWLLEEISSNLWWVDPEAIKEFEDSIVVLD